MASVRVVLNLAGIRELKRAPGVAADIARRADRVLASAKASAPVKTGAYRDGLRVEMDEHPIVGTVAHIGSTARHAPLVEASTGNLARSLDAAGGA